MASLTSLWKHTCAGSGLNQFKIMRGKSSEMLDFRKKVLEFDAQYYQLLRGNSGDEEPGCSNG